MKKKTVVILNIFGILYNSGNFTAEKSLNEKFFQEFNLI